MASSRERYPGESPGYGWVVFAGTMIAIVGVLNFIYGIAAISDSKYLVKQLLFANLHAWGWFFLIWGAIQIFTGFAIFRGAPWAAIVGVISAFFNAIAQLSWIGVNPWWAFIAIAIDVMIIYGLLVYGGRGKETYAA